jgi:hypothetical protein
MATVNKNFKIKSGLVVEGTTGTINGEDILTKAQADIDYIIGEVGGSGVSTNTPDTLVLRDGSGNFAAGTITADLTGDVTGTVSDISNHDTDDLSEGTSNKYFTEGRVKDVLTGSTQTNISITEIAGELHITAENGVDDSTTDDLSEGTTNKYFTDTRARGAISGGTGINYDSSTGVVSADLADFDTDDVSEGATNKYFTEQRVFDSLSGGSAIDFNGSTGDISVALNEGGGLTNSNDELSIDRTTVDGWYDASGTAATEAGYVATDLSTHTTASSGVHGITGSVVGTSDEQTLSNKDFNGATQFHAANGAGSLEVNLNTSTGAATITNNNDDLTITTNGGDIVLNASGTAYLDSATAGNEIATHGYVDNAVSGLTWKQSVNLLYNDSTPTLSGDSVTTPLVIDGHSALDAGDVGYRILVSSGDDAGIYVYNQTGTSWTLDRAADGDTYQELVGAAVYIMEGTTYGSTSWVQGNHYLSAFTGQSWTQFSGQGSVTAGTGIIVDGLEVSVDTDVIATQYYADSAVGTHSDYTSNVHGVTGDVVGTSDSQVLTNKTVNDELYFTNPATQANDGGIKVDNGNEDFVVHAYTADLELIGYGDVNITSNNGDINLNPDGNVFINGSSPSNQVATQGYVDNQTTDDVSEGSTNQYFTQSRARGSFSAGNAISYNSTSGEIAVDASQLDTDDISEGTSNKYYTDARVKDVLTGATQTNISITEVGGELIITAENGVDDSTTDDLEEGTFNHYFTDTRAKTSAADLLTSATLSNITITGDETGLTITAENGVSGSDTDDLTEGSTNLYFTNQRALDAVANSTIYPNAVEINDYRKEEATRVSAGSTSTVNLHSFEYPYESAKYLVRVVGWVGGVKHSQLTEILMTVDGNNNIAISEYGTISTNDASLASFNATESAGVFTLTATVGSVSSCEIVTAATLLSWAD